MEPEKRSIESDNSRPGSEPGERSKSLSSRQFARTNFDFLYDSFHQPLTDIISSEGEIIGINKKGELKRFEHNEDTEAIEGELCKYAKSKSCEMLDLRLTYYYNNHNGSLNDTLKYIMCFYKVNFYLLRKIMNRACQNISKEVMIRQRRITSIASICLMEIRSYITI